MKFKTENCSSSRRKCRKAHFAAPSSVRRKVMSAHLEGNYTGWTAWGLLFAAYPNVLCQDKGLMYATNPWGGERASYNVQPTIYTTAHITQFTKVGWRFLSGV